MAYADKRTEFGMLPQAQLLDIAIASAAFVGAIVQVSPADYKSLGIAAIGAILGGLIAAGRFRNTMKVPLLEMWGISTLSSIVFSPMIFEWLSIPKLNTSGEIIAAAYLSRTAESLLGVSAFVALCAWGLLAIAYYGFEKIVRKWINKVTED